MIDRKECEFAMGLIHAYEVKLVHIAAEAITGGPETISAMMTAMIGVTTRMQILTSGMPKALFLDIIAQSYDLEAVRIEKAKAEFGEPGDGQQTLG